MNPSLFDLAKAAQTAAYSPYSQRKIGAALRLSNGKTYSGCNIENSSYGGTVCAERVAIWKALSENPGARVTEICVISDVAAGEAPWPPCGFCRQVLAEFADASTPVHLANLQNVVRSISLGELLPEAFAPNFLSKN